MTFSSVHHNKVHFLEEDFLWVEALLKLETKKKQQFIKIKKFNILVIFGRCFVTMYHI